MLAMRRIVLMMLIDRALMVWEALDRFINRNMAAVVFKDLPFSLLLLCSLTRIPLRMIHVYLELIAKYKLLRFAMAIWVVDRASSYPLPIHQSHAPKAHDSPRELTVLTLSSSSSRSSGSAPQSSRSSNEHPQHACACSQPPPHQAGSSPPQHPPRREA